MSVIAWIEFVLLFVALVFVLVVAPVLHWIAHLRREDWRVKFWSEHHDC